MFFRRKTADAPACLLIGLGNPGARYAATRHNAGWWVLDALARQATALRTISRHRSQADFCKVGGVSVALIKPLTYMNLSGESVALWRRDFPEAEWIVACDDLALDAGVLRLRERGSSGGQKGLQSIIDTLGTPDFPRLRLGIGAAPPGQDAADYVLEPPPLAQRKLLEAALPIAARTLAAFAAGGYAQALRELNAAKTKPAPPPRDRDTQTGRQSE